MPISEDILTLEIEPPYIGSAVSPTVDIAETTDDITVTITDFRGEHSYTVEKTDQAIEDAEQAAQNANDTAQTVAQGWTSKLAEINGTLAQQREQMGSAAVAESQRVTAENLRVNAENERVQEWDELSANAEAATSAATEAAGRATTATQGATSAANAADDATTRANNTITGITQTANQIFAQAGQATIDANAAAQSANDAATNATTKAGLADTAAQNADTATIAANNAAQTANTAAEQADAAREAIQDDLAAKADKDGYYQQLTAGLADTLMSGDAETVQFAKRVSDRDGMARIESLRGNTVLWNQLFNGNGSSSTSSDVTFTHNTDGSWTVNGTASATASKTINGNVAVIQGHKYIVKGCPSGGSSSTYSVVLSGSSYVGSVRDSGNGATFTAIASGNISPVVSIASGYHADNLVFKPQLFDLTTMFGAGNEPTTVEEFERMFPEDYYPYDVDSLLSVNIEGVKSVGKNRVKQMIKGYIDTSNNTIKIDNASESCLFYAIAGMTYTFSSTPRNNRSIIGHVAIENVVNLTPVIEYVNLNTAALTTWTALWTGWSVWYVSATKNEQIAETSQIEIGSVATAYVPYRESVREIPVSTYFPDGLRSAGTAYDELDFVSHKAVTRIGAVDLGTLTWMYDTTSGHENFEAALSGAVVPSGGNAMPNLECAALTITILNNVYNHVVDKAIALHTAQHKLYAYNSAYTDAAAFKAAMNGVMLYYELATPTETDLPENLQATYPVEIGGIESIVIPTGEHSSSPTLAIVYSYTADGVRDETQSIVAPVEHGTASSNYSVGSYLVMGGTLYRVTTAIATGETINPGTNCTATTVMAEIVRLTA